MKKYLVILLVLLAIAAFALRGNFFAAEKEDITLWGQSVDNSIELSANMAHAYDEPIVLENFDGHLGGWTKENEPAAYWGIRIREGGEYQVTFRYSRQEHGTAGGSMRLQLLNEETGEWKDWALYALHFKSTGDWSEYSTFNRLLGDLEAGQGFRVIIRPDPDKEETGEYFINLAAFKIEPWVRKVAADAPESVESLMEQADALNKQKEYARALPLYLQEAEAGSAEAQIMAGLYYAEGRGIEESQSDATEWYRKAAGQGHAIAQFNLAVRYANGRGVDRDDAQAAHWYRKAAEQGDADAQYSMAVRYDNGQGVDMDDAQAVEWYRKAAEQGHTKAQYNLGVMYANGEGVAKDDTEAARWYLKAAEEGHARAQYTMAVRYNNGRGVDRDDAQALQWLQKSAEQGYEDAQEYLSEHYRDGRRID